MKSPDSYHHGDLRPALVEAAIDIIRKDGVDALTLRRVARQAGVSHAAPYHHFADRRSLVAAVAEQGFAKLAEAAEKARRSSAPSEQLLEAGVAYVVFAVRHPEHFRIMFSREIADTTPFPELRASAAEAKAVLERAVEASVGTGAGPGRTERRLVTSWALVHGLATLLIDDQLGTQANTPAGAARLTREALGTPRGGA